MLNIGLEISLIENDKYVELKVWIVDKMDMTIAELVK